MRRELLCIFAANLTFLPFDCHSYVMMMMMMMMMMMIVTSNILPSLSCVMVGKGIDDDDGRQSHGV